jgi:hypothetical protein
VSKVTHQGLFQEHRKEIHVMKFFRVLAERIRHGYRIADDCYIAGGGRDELIVELKSKKIRITYESLPGKPSMLIYPSKDRKWLPPHEHQAVSDADYHFIIDAVVKSYEKDGETVECQW